MPRKTERQPLATPFRTACAAVVIVVAGPSFAAEWKISPSIAANETATDNVNLSADKKGDLVTDINPGISIEGSGGRSKLRFDYQLHNLVYAQDSSRNKTQNSLNAQGTLEAIENWLFIDASGVISQQNISAFGGSGSSSVNSSSANNTTETSTYRLSPYVKGSLGTFADYQLRYNLMTSSSKTSSVYDSKSRELSGGLKGETSLAHLGWSVDMSSQTVDFDNGRTNDADRLRGVLTYQVDPQVRVSLIGGREANNYLTPEKEARTTRGVGLDWSPTERTQVSLSREHRFFGDSNSVNLSHRTEGSAWKYAESKDVQVQPTQQLGLGTVYDQFYSLFYAALRCASMTGAEQTSCANDASTAAINRALSFGVSPNAPGGFLASGATLQHKRELSFSLLGARNTVTLLASQNDSESLSQGAGTGFNIGNSFTNAQKIRQRVASLNWSHQLSAQTSLTGAYSRINTVSLDESDLETRQNTINVNLLTQLGPSTNASVGFRHVTTDGTTSYTENALTGMLSHRF